MLQIIYIRFTLIYIHNVLIPLGVPNRVFVASADWQKGAVERKSLRNLVLKYAEI